MTIYAVSLTALSVQLHIYATNCIAKCPYKSTEVKTKTKAFLCWPGMDYTNMK